MKSGQVTLAGKTPTELGGFPSWRSQVSYVPQTKPDVPGSPIDLVTLASSFGARHAIDPDAQLPKDVLRDTAERLELPGDALGRPWSSLSSGEAQRALVAVHLAMRPAFLLLDEPTSACDEASAALVEAELQECGSGLLWISQ